MSEQPNPLERAVDLFVFAPVGVAMFAKDTVPTFMKMFVSRGQTELASRKKSLHDHANQYRTVGKFAVKYGGPVVKQQAEEKIGGARRLAEETFSGLIVSRGGGADETPGAAAAAAAEKITAASAAKADGRTASSVNGATNGTVAATTPTNGTNGRSASVNPTPVHVAPALAIPEYDQLSASQVVERLDGLTPDELDAVRAYEVAHRGRSTILGKITQLTS